MQRLEFTPREGKRDKELGRGKQKQNKKTLTRRRSERAMKNNRNENPKLSRKHQQKITVEEEAKG